MGGRKNFFLRFSSIFTPYATTLELTKINLPTFQKKVHFYGSKILKKISKYFLEINHNFKSKKFLFYTKIERVSHPISQGKLPSQIPRENFLLKTLLHIPILSYSQYN